MKNRSYLHIIIVMKQVIHFEILFFFCKNTIFIFRLISKFLWWRTTWYSIFLSLEDWQYLSIKIDLIRLVCIQQSIIKLLILSINFRLAYVLECLLWRVNDAISKKIIAFLCCDNTKITMQTLDHYITIPNKKRDILTLILVLNTKC